MQEFKIIYDLLIILCTALLFGYLARKIKQPAITGYVIGGAVVSLLGGKLLTNSISTLADIGVILLMFTLGVEFSFRRLTKIKNIVVWGAIAQIVIFSIVFIGVSLFLFQLSFYQALFLSLAFSLSSTAITVKLLFDRGETDTLHGEILTGWLLIQDLAVIPLWVLLPNIAQIFAKGGFDLKVVAWDLFLNLLKSGIILYFVFWLGKRIVPFILSRVAKTNTRELFLITIVLLISAVALGVSFVGLSPALGAFIAGLLIAETVEHVEVFAETRPLRDILSIIFFVSLGLLFNAQFLFSHFFYIAALTGVVLLLKFLVVIRLMAFFGFHSRISFLTAIGLTSVGEFAFILGRFGLVNNYLSDYSYQILLSTSVLTMIFSPWLISGENYFYSRIYSFLKKYFPFLFDKLFTGNEPTVNVYEKLAFTDHVVICGHGRVGSHISKILDRAQIPYVVVDFNQKVVSDLKRHAVNAIYGDPSEIDVLDYAKVDKAKVIVIAVPDRHSQEIIIRNSLQLNSEIVIICRSHHEEDANRLYALGAHSIIMPEFEAAIHMGGVLLKLYKFAPEEIIKHLNSERREA